MYIVLRATACFQGLNYRGDSFESVFSAGFFTLCLRGLYSQQSVHSPAACNQALTEAHLWAQQASTCPWRAEPIHLDLFLSLKDLSYLWIQLHALCYSKRQQIGTWQLGTSELNSWPQDVELKRCAKEVKGIIIAVWSLWFMTRCVWNWIKWNLLILKEKFTQKCEFCHLVTLMSLQTYMASVSPAEHKVKYCEECSYNENQ